MASGIKAAANRPKPAKHLRSQRKKFVNDDPAAKAAYASKLAQRAMRKKNRKAKR